MVLSPDGLLNLTFLAEGALNKLYDVSIDGDAFILRVSLPVDPGFKIMSEVATMDWVRRITSLSIPKAIAYQSSRDNPIGFEWILMTKMPGKPLGEVWHSLSFRRKIAPGSRNCKKLGLPFSTSNTRNRKYLWETFNFDRG